MRGEGEESPGHTPATKGPRPRPPSRAHRRRPARVPAAPGPRTTGGSGAGRPHPRRGDHGPRARSPALAGRPRPLQALPGCWGARPPTPNGARRARVEGPGPPRRPEAAQPPAPALAPASARRPDCRRGSSPRARAAGRHRAFLLARFLFSRSCFTAAWRFPPCEPAFRPVPPLADLCLRGSPESQIRSGRWLPRLPPPE